MWVGFARGCHGMFITAVCATAGTTGGSVEDWKEEAGPLL